MPNENKVIVTGIYENKTKKRIYSNWAPFASIYSSSGEIIGRDDGSSSPNIINPKEKLYVSVSVPKTKSVDVTSVNIELRQKTTAKRTLKLATSSLSSGIEENRYVVRGNMINNNKKRIKYPRVTILFFDINGNLLCVGDTSAKVDRPLSRGQSAEFEYKQSFFVSLIDSYQVIGYEDI